MKNYWKIKKRSLFSVSYAYVDHISYPADQLLAQNEVAVKYKGEMRKENLDYCVIFCKVRKKDAERFEEALGRLENKILLMGYQGYDEICGEIEKMMQVPLQNISQIS